MVRAGCNAGARGALACGTRGARVRGVVLQRCVMSDAALVLSENCEQGIFAIPFQGLF